MACADSIRSTYLPNFVKGILTRFAYLAPRDHTHADDFLVTFEPGGGIPGEKFADHGGQNKQSLNQQRRPIAWLQGIQDADIDRCPHGHEEERDKEMAEMGNPSLDLMGLALQPQSPDFLRLGESHG